MVKGESSAPKSYRERVLPSPGTFMAVALLMPAIALVLEPFNAFAGVLAGMAATMVAWALLIFTAPLVQVSTGQLQVGKAKISIKHLGQLRIIEKGQIFEERGPKLSPGAYRVFQGSVKTALKVEIVDQTDPTPYWLFSTRNPAKLVESINSWPKG